MDIIYPWNNSTEHQLTSVKLTAFILGNIEPVCIYRQKNNDDNTDSIEMQFFSFYKDHLDKYYNDFFRFGFHLCDYENESYFKHVFGDMYDFIAGEDCMPRYKNFTSHIYTEYCVSKVLLYVKFHHIFDGYSERDERYVINAIHPSSFVSPEKTYEFSCERNVYIRKYLEVQLFERLSGLHYYSWDSLHYCKNRTNPYNNEIIPKKERIPYVGDADLSRLKLHGIMKHFSMTRYIDENELLAAYLCFDQIIYMEQQLELMLLNNEYVNPEDFDWNDLDVPLYLSCIMQDGSYQLFRI